MALNIKSGETDRLVRELAALTGESITDAVTKAVAERLERCRQTQQAAAAERLAKLERIMERSKRHQRVDPRSADEILGYDEDGLFK